MKRNFKLILEYDGTHYHGWQRQPHDLTIQEVLEGALEKITRQKCVVYGAGRTDSGVHALNYVANFRCNTHLDAGVFVKALNSTLPKDIVCKESTLAPDGFHARKSAVSKIYEYHITNGPTPPAVCRQYAWHVRRRLDKEAMTRAAELFLGSHDFSAFEGAGSPKATSVRNIMQSHIQSWENHIIYRVEANGFLRYMVRNIVGTLVYIGMGKIPPEAVMDILASGDRGQAGPTAPPEGLFMMCVKY
ncbi:tRNA pseudouridine(38-40) synthase TruA [Desulfatibacillum aliphaticivorans]|uniref:tRNA pseudouridine(38-40) synthase TruA n=1 Tax=Desulfatibacillum aliphaticivorans TaxID=218208 RepID=UPI0004204D72|nr:tRNA pseudouridine(38-40) synthase TruA [Desulfatibacillum aliphaticivorans]